MTTKNTDINGNCAARDRIRTWWPVIVFAVSALIFGGTWYQRTCALEDSMRSVTNKVDVMGGHLETLQRNLAGMDYQLTNTAETVRDIQTILLQNRTAAALTTR